MRFLFLLTLIVSAACRSNGADPGEVRMANKRVERLKNIVATLEAGRLRDACQVADLLMRENAIQRVDLAGKMARVKQLEQLLHVVTQSRRVSKRHHMTATDIAARLVSSVKGGTAPAFVIIVDLKSRVVARVGMNADRYGDVLNTAVISEALHGYMRDDVWVINDSLYRVAIAPIVQRELKEGYGGAIVVGHAMGKPFASEMAKRLRVEVGFYKPARTFAQSRSIPAVERAIRAAMGQLEGDRDKHCVAKPTVVDNAGDSYLMLTARLPGNAGASHAAYAVYARRSVRPSAPPSKE